MNDKVRRRMSAKSIPLTALDSAMGILRSVLTEKKTPEKADVSECRGFPSLSKYHEMRKGEVLEVETVWR